jgi:beta-fructofuranosidase
MTLPRILSIGADGFLRQIPAAEFDTLRGSAMNEGPLELVPGETIVLRQVQGQTLEIRADVVPGSAAEVAFDLRRSDSGKAGVTVRLSRTGLLSVGTTQIQVSRALERYSLRIFLDRRVVEVYVNDGEAAVFGTVDAASDALGVAITSQAASGRGVGPAPGAGRGAAAPANARVVSLTAWPMAAARFSFEHFHL